MSGLVLANVPPLNESFKLSRFDSVEGSPSYRNDSVAVRLWPRHFLRTEKLCFCWTCTVCSVCFSSRRFGCAAFCNTMCTVCSPLPQQHPLFDLLALTAVCLLSARPSSSAVLTLPSVARCGPSCCTTTAMTPPLRRGRPGGCRNVPTTTTSSRGGEEQGGRNKCVFVEKYGEICEQMNCHMAEPSAAKRSVSQTFNHMWVFSSQQLEQSIPTIREVWRGGAGCEIKKSLWRKNMSVLIR